MDTLSHSIHASWVGILLYWLFWQSFPTPMTLILIFIAGNIPDFDGIYWKLKGGKHDQNFQHHLYFWSHWPISYSPLLVVLLLSVIFDFAVGWVVIILSGILTHFVCDSMSCGDGMMWGKKPWKSNEFAPYINLISTKTDGYHGNYWTYRFRQTNLFKIVNIEAIILIGIIIYVMFFSNAPIIRWTYLIPIFAICILMGINFIPMDKKFREEPSEGRYADYRKLPAYLDWMKTNGYEFNENFHVRKRQQN